MRVLLEGRKRVFIMRQGRHDDGDDDDYDETIVKRYYHSGLLITPQNKRRC
jgi:hypothetical protein